VLALSRRRRLRGDVAIGGRGAELADEVEDGLGQCGESLGAHTAAQRRGGNMAPRDSASHLVGRQQSA